MPAIRRVIVGILAVLLPAVAAQWGGAGSDRPSEEETLQRAERAIHRPAGADAAGKPASADPSGSGRIRLKVIDAETGGPVFCRVNVVGSDGNYYEPADNPLAPWSLHRQGNRDGKGPFRYYGWFFYSDGTCEVAVPPGRARIEVWKGFEYAPAVAHAEVGAGDSANVRVKLRRAVDMAGRGWHSGDTHIHMNRRDDADDERVLDLAAAEDIRFAHILCMNDTRTYSPSMDSQTWPQRFRLGKKSVRFRGEYGIASGQEYRCNTFGHICLVGASGLVQGDGEQTDPNNWPVFGRVADETHDLGGYAIHAHGGYAKEIYADAVRGVTDGVELLQFAVYRGISLEGWYHMLNAGFRLPAVAASDYPYCRALGDCRTYVDLGDAEPTFAAWDEAVAAGRSFLTTGPLLELTVEGKRPGTTLERPAGQRKLTVRVRLNSPVAPVEEVRLIEAGRLRARRRLTGDDRTGPVTWTTELPVSQSTWVAARAVSGGLGGREDVEAHTNPVYVKLGGESTPRPESLRWLLQRLEERIAYHAGRDFPEKQRVLAYFRESRRILRRRLQAATENRSQ